MRRCLIVANQTLDTDQLADAVQQRQADQEHEFYLVVPATPLNDQESGPAAYASARPSTQDRAYALARQRLDRALKHLRQLDITVDGEVGDPDALEAVRLALTRFDPDEIIVSTLPPGLSRWLRRDLPTRIGRSFQRPVTHLVAEASRRT